MQKDGQHNAEEVEHRLQKALQGAFSGAPTPLKDIPTKYGESRKLRRISGGASSASAKTAARRTCWRIDRKELGRKQSSRGLTMAPGALGRRTESAEPQSYATFDGRERSVDNERLTRSTTWKRVIITVVSAWEHKARSISDGVQVRPFVRFLTVMIASKISSPIASGRPASPKRDSGRSTQPFMNTAEIIVSNIQVR